MECILAKGITLSWSKSNILIVNIYGSSGSEALRGNHENTEVGKFLREYIGVDVDAITAELVEKSKTFTISGMAEKPWTGNIPTEEMLEAAVSVHERSNGIEP